MKTQLIFAGHGGQGVLELANYVSFYELLKGRHVAYTPSYGPESRGGKVKCYVITSDDVIDSPIVEEPDYLIVMNNPSMDYIPLLKSGGTLLMNSSLITDGPKRDDIRVIKVPVTEIAYHLKEFGLQGIQDTKISANAVMLGAYLATSGEELNKEIAKEAFDYFLKGRKAPFVPLNMIAIQQGYEFTKGMTVTTS